MMTTLVVDCFGRHPTHLGEKCIESGRFINSNLEAADLSFTNKSIFVNIQINFDLFENVI